MQQGKGMGLTIHKFYSQTVTLHQFTVLDPYTLYGQLKRQGSLLMDNDAYESYHVYEEKTAGLTIEYLSKLVDE